MGWRKACIRGLVTEEKNKSQHSFTHYYLVWNKTKILYHFWASVTCTLTYYVYLGMHKTEGCVMCHHLRTRPIKINGYWHWPGRRGKWEEFHPLASLTPRVFQFSNVKNVRLNIYTISTSSFSSWYHRSTLEVFLRTIP